MEMIRAEQITLSLRWVDNNDLDSFIFGWYNGTNWTQTTESADLESGNIQYKGTSAGIDEDCVALLFQKNINAFADAFWIIATF